MLFALSILLKERPEIRLDGTSKKYLFLRSLCGTIGILCNFYAVDHLVLADASMLNKMSPFFAILFGILILKEKINLFQGLCVITAFTGTLFVIKPTPSNLACFPALIGLLGGLTAGMAYTYVRALGTRGVKGPFIVFFFSAFSCIAVLPYIILNFEPMTLKQLCMLLLAGLAASGGQFGVTYAYKYAPAREISIYDYTQVIFAAILGFIVFGQLPDGLSFIGYTIICGVSVLMYIYNMGYFKKKC
jgi:drug/metabolite transporter (DMT)-like permease